tara:strand:+ start:229915 stop:230433 length:519 start_codon:yes stop_codon:yes gene_type:complete
LASPVPFAENAHGVRVRPLDFDAEGAPTIKTYHGISIVVGGRIVGRIQSFKPNMYTRQGNHVYEVNHLTFGRPVDYVPSINEGYNISVSRVEVWNQEFELALGYSAVWSDLIDQNRPFTIQEYLFKGNTVYRVWLYSGCWFTNRNEDGFESKGDAQIKATGEIQFVSRTRTV